MENKKENKNKKIIIFSVILGVIVLAICMFVLISFALKIKDKKELEKNKELYIEVYNKARLAYADINLAISTSIATEGFDEVKSDTILYWDDYINNQVYGYSYYGLKSFSEVDDKVYEENKDVFDNLETNNDNLYKWNKFIEETKVTDENSIEYKDSMLNYYSSYERLYNSIFAFNTSFSGFKSDTATAISNYNSAMNDFEYYSGKYNNEYLKEYNNLVLNIGFDKYCDVWSNEVEDMSYTNFQNCYEEINENLEIK